ncbi:MmcB family DNA repair protein [Dongia sp.]|uniref:MmcB family DNA repair protein n=1 Tax=Dongia sp. TaxID=1977262 RepID=UPI0035ADC59D
MPDSLFPAGADGPAQPLIAADIARGVMRLFADLGYAAVPEVPLRAKRRADIMALNAAGEFVIVEIKSCRADFRADQKWPEYLDFCDRFYFAVAADFPREILPEDRGLIIGDRHGAAILREAVATPLNGNRRRAQTLQLAMLASQRLARVMEMVG